MRHLIFISFLFISFSGSAQYLTESYTSFDLSVGPRSFSSTPGDYQLSFTTNIENHSFKRTLEDSHNYIAYSIGASFGKYKGLNGQIFFEGPFGGQGTGVFGISAGWGLAIELDKNDILLRPSLGISNGSSNIRFGRFGVDSTTQLILGEEFQNTNVKVDLDQKFTYLIPELKATFLFAQKHGVFVSVAYDYIISNKAQAFRFHGNRNGGETTVEITDDFLNYIRTDAIGPISIDQEIFKPGGLRFSIGISTYVNKDLYD